MSYEQTLIIILTINFVGYVSTVWAKFGVLPSISDSFYAWKGQWCWLFTLFCWIMTFTILPIEPNPFFFFTAAGLGFVGAAAQIKDKFVEKVHVKGAVIGISAGLLGIGFTYGDWWLVISALIIAGLIKLFKIKNDIWWIEITAYSAVIISLYKNFF